MPTGTVKFFSAVMGFGFVAPDEGDAEVVAPISALEAAGLPGLSVGDRIAYDLQDDGLFGKPAATNVQIISTPSAEQFG